MATSRTSQETSPLHSTRQMLDELDALMERMLSLPVGDADELPPLPRDILKAPTVSASLTVLDEDEPVATEPESTRPFDASPSTPLLFEEEEAAEQEEPVLFSERVEMASRAKTAKVNHEEPAAELHRYYSDEVEQKLPPPLVINRPVQVVAAAPVVTGVSAGKRAPARPRRLLSDICLAPAVWANRAFDRCTEWLGPLGQGLRSQPGRTFLGLVGLACLGVAGVWLVKDVGWTR